MSGEIPAGVPPSRPRLSVQALLGVMVIAIGVLFTLDNLDIVDARVVLQYWPVGLVAVGLLKLYHASRGGQGWVGGLFFVSIGAWMLIEQVVYFRIDMRQVAPLFLVFLGGYLVWRGFGGRRAERASDGHSTFSALAIMGGVVRRSNSQTFRGADLTAVMGGCDIDLRQASIPAGTEAVIDAFAFWGGIDLKVPADWTIVTRVIPIMGGVDDKTHAPATSDKRLVIRGIAIMGGLSVKNTGRVNGQRD